MLQTKIKNALALKKRIKLPNLSKATLLLILSVAGYLFVCYLASPAHEKEYQFASEDGALTALSAIFLAAAAAFACVAYYISRKTAMTNPLFWLLSAGGFFFLSLDELMKMHEALGWLSEEYWIEPVLFRNWNDLIVIGYGLVALSGAFFFIEEVLRYPRFIEALGVAFLFFLLHTIIDSVVEPRTTISAIVEESSKLFCSAFLSLSSFIGMMGVMSLNQNNIIQSGHSEVVS